MKNYKITVKVEVKESDEPIHGEPTKQSNGSIEMVIDEADAVSIDNCEKAMLKTNYEAIRDAISKHLTEISKKRPLKKGN